MMNEIEILLLAGRVIRIIAFLFLLAVGIRELLDKSNSIEYQRNTKGLAIWSALLYAAGNGVMVLAGGM